MPPRGQGGDDDVDTHDKSFANMSNMAHDLIMEICKGSRASSKLVWKSGKGDDQGKELMNQTGGPYSSRMSFLYRT